MVSVRSYAVERTGPTRLEQKGEYSDGMAWSLEIETDRFANGEPIVVSVWIDTDDGDGLAILTAAEARHAAGVLLRAADEADQANRTDAA